MCEQLISLSPDLKRLRDEGYDIDVVSSYLIVRDVPYVNTQKEVNHGILISELNLAGDRTVQPKNHTVLFSGEHPCTKDGMLLKEIQHQSAQQKIAEGIISQHSFSCKPVVNGQKVTKYADYHEKMTTYISVISGQAQAINPSVTARTFNVIESSNDDTVFKYKDTASSRADIMEVSLKLANHKLAIIGLGGSGSYILDFIAKTPVSEIHLFDKDLYQQHNAFRSPGAATLSELREKFSKAVYYAKKYGEMHSGIVAHEVFVDLSNIVKLKNMDFVFICIDKASAKRPIVEKLEEFGLSFIDVGMGLGLVDGALDGLVCATTSLPSKREHFKRRVSLGDNDDSDNEYSRNIQIAELNALNAIMAVIKWKKLLGFYIDDTKELYSVYNVVNNQILNEEREYEEENKLSLTA